MRCLILVKFMKEGSLPPEEFLARVNAVWSRLEDTDAAADGDFEKNSHPQPSKSAVCIADCESVEQLGKDLATMPGAGISSVEVFPVSEVTEYQVFV